MKAKDGTKAPSSKKMVIVRRERVSSAKSAACRPAAGHFITWRRIVADVGSWSVHLNGHQSTTVTSDVHLEARWLCRAVAG